PRELRDNARLDVKHLCQHTKFSEESLRRIIISPEVSLDLRCKAAWLVGLIREYSFADVLERVIEEGDPSALLWEAAKTLSILGRGHALFRRLVVESRDPEARKVGVFALGQLHDLKAVELLVSVLASPDETPTVRGQAAESLGYLANLEALEPLLAATA